MTGLDLVKKYESCRLKAYKDPATGGLPITIGWGATRNKDNESFKLGDEITQEMADALLVRDFNAVKDQIDLDLPTECIDAIACLCYNIKGGWSAFKKSKCYRGILDKDCSTVFHNWDWGVNQDKVKLGLSRRRAEELTMFFEGLVNGKVLGWQ